MQVSCNMNFYNPNSGLIVRLYEDGRRGVSRLRYSVRYTSTSTVLVPHDTRTTGTYLYEYSDTEYSTCTCRTTVLVPVPNVVDTPY